MEVKSVVITSYAMQTLNKEFEYHKENSSLAFANKLKNSFVELVDGLSQKYLVFPECRFLPSKNKVYRNIVWRDYLIIYKILKKEVLVLGIFHCKQNPVRLKSFRRVK